MARRISTGLAGSGGGAGTLQGIETSVFPVTANSNITLDANGTGQTVITSRLSNTNSTASTTTATGALISTGGLGIEQNVFVGGSISAIAGIDAPINIPPESPTSGSFTSVSSTGLFTFRSISEVSNVKTGATGVVVHDYTEGSVWYHGGIAANFTVNLTNVPTTNDRNIMISLILDQGGTARYATGIQVDGVAQTIRWPGFNLTFTPTAGRKELQTFVLSRSGSAWTVRTYFSSYGEGIGTTPLTAAVSAQAIKTANPTATSGLYWLKPAAWTFPALCYCEMTLHGGGWVYLMQRLCVNDQGLPGSWLTSQAAFPNHTVQDFYGTRDLMNNQLTPQNIWDGIVGSGASQGRFFAREIQIRTGGGTGGTYSESQRYVSASDGNIWTWATFSRLFSGNFANGQFQSGVTVWLDNGATQATGKIGTTWSAPALATINNGNVDQNLYFCNGEDGGDSNWSFALMKGGTPYPRLADATNGGGRHNNISRWAIIGIKA